MQGTDLSTAIVHKHYQIRGGAEYVVEELARVFQAPIYTGFINDSALPGDHQLEFHDVYGDSRLMPLIHRSGLVRELYNMFAWQYCPELTEFDVLIQTAPTPGWYVPEPDQVVIRYVHDLPRTAYDRFQEVGSGPFRRFYSHLFRVFYQPYIHFPDRYVVNSEVTARLLDRYWGISDPTVVHPPVDVDGFETGDSGDYYLTYSRLTNRKNVDQIIRAFEHHSDKRLIIGGTGPDEDLIRDLAASLGNVEFRGYLGEDEKRTLLREARAVIFAAENESFGIVPIEAFASGKPVIGVNSGFTRYQVEDGKTGILFDPGTLSDAITRFEAEGVTAGPEVFANEVDQYREERFRTRIKEVVYEAVDEIL